MSRSRKKTEGFTLIEVLVAFFVMALTTTSAAVCFQVAFKQYDDARALNHLTEVLQDHAESMRLLNWADIVSLETTAEVPLSEYLHNSDFTNFTLSHSISDSDLDNLKLIHIAATCTTRHGSAQTRSIDLSYTLGGINDYYYGLGD
jgi:Tfp pilus assembly protein PilV